MKKRERRTLKRRLKSQRRRLRRQGDTTQYAIVNAALADNDILDQTVDSIKATAAIGDGNILEFLLNIDWDRLIAIITQIIGSFA